MKNIKQIVLETRDIEAVFEEPQEADEKTWCCPVIGWALIEEEDGHQMLLPLTFNPIKQGIDYDSLRMDDLLGLKINKKEYVIKSNIPIP